jgi:hypothetical protein
MRIRGLNCKEQTERSSSLIAIVYTCIYNIGMFLYEIIDAFGSLKLKYAVVDEEK